MRWLAGLSPRDELVTRMALRDHIRDPRVSRKWEARIAKLKWDLIDTSDDIVALSTDVRRAKGQIAKIVETGLK
jgi:hypothetical protein